ncbi:hypothetical protein A8W25_28740 [Streptomyces sp. ERV7]|uniref:hypothetical protein n=1 Tax=Streptomyces sp. ERV7 TaxID=1322334 RepID=UPI0007F4C288|nr:hypothetical protein [Streptomyces sp. ERV7]OAR25054.1 hypothetical protein A8W25_28740 [Streptomyces sp. ERV7]
MRADAITYLSANDHQVRASELGSDDITVLVDEKDAGFNGPLLPSLTPPNHPAEVQQALTTH